MCGRYATTKTDNDLRGVYGILGGGTENGPAWPGAVSIPPTSTAPLVRERVDDAGTVERELEPAQWGLRPHWMNDPKKRGFHNARLETVADKPSSRWTAIKSGSTPASTSSARTTRPTLGRSRTRSSLAQRGTPPVKFTTACRCS